MIKFPWSLDKTPPPGQKKWGRLFEHHLPNLSISLMILVLAGAILYPHVVITVPSGEVGVLWKRFGGGTVVDKNGLAGEGIHFIFPWDMMFLYDLRLQSSTDAYNAISRDGANLAVTINVRFRLDRDHVGLLQKDIGPDFMNLLVRPEIGSRAREIISQYKAEDVYSSDRREIEKKIRDATIKKLAIWVRGTEAETEDKSVSNLINIYDTLLLSIELPSSVVAAINSKIDQYYAVQEYQFLVEREKKESERKQIEANGIAAFQKIVSQGISDSYLRWRGIEATLQLAQSTNAKVVVIGSGKDGLPIILGNDVSTALQHAPSPNQGGSPTVSTSSSTPGAVSAASPAKGTSSWDFKGLLEGILGQTPPQTHLGTNPVSSNVPSPH
jgi:prohibitin 2